MGGKLFCHSLKCKIHWWGGGGCKENVLKLYIVVIVALKSTKLFALKGSILWYVNYISILVFFFRNSAPVFAETKEKTHYKLNHDKRKSA